MDKITGPGNAWVATAKRQVFGQVGIDAIAGPSEVMILADKQNNADWIAMDLMAQAEHDENAQSILITNDENFAEAVMQEVENILKKPPAQNHRRRFVARFRAASLSSKIGQKPPP